MLIKNTERRFGLISIALHWIIALLMIALIIVGLYMTRIPISAWKLKLFRWHKEFGMLVLMLALVRLTWRLINPVPSLSNLPLWEIIAARLAHYAFYGFMFLLPITGLLLSSAAGIPGVFFGLFVFPDMIDPNESLRLAFTNYHAWLSYLLIALLSVHIAASFKHHFINKDDILKRILWP